MYFICMYFMKSKHLIFRRNSLFDLLCAIDSRIQMMSHVTVMTEMAFITHLQ